MSTTPRSTDIATPAPALPAVVERLRSAGCAVDAQSGDLTVTVGDLASISTLAGAMATSGVEFLDLWEDTTPDDAAARRHNVLCASGHQLLLHRVRVGPGEVAASIVREVSAALPFEIDTRASRWDPSDPHIDRGATGTGVFTIPFGPVRSGVVEAMFYQIDTAGEDMLLVQPRPGFKRRGLERRLCAVPLDQVPLVAERIAGTYSVAGAVAVCRAVESIAGIEPTAEAAAVRLVLAELERIHNHCDSILKLTDDASLIVGTAQMGMLKERILRLLAALSGHRYGRGIVTVGGVQRGLAASNLRDELRRFGDDSSRVRRLLLRTDSFLDRLERTGGLPTDVAAALGATGPVARGSHLARDARVQRPYEAYRERSLDVAVMSDCDVMARTEVRMTEIRASLRLVVDVVVAQDSALTAPPPPHVELPPHTVGAGWVESPEGEWVAVLETGSHGQLVNARVRPASIANFACFQRACERWVLTDFAFIEHSFGLSIAGRDR